MTISKVTLVLSFVLFGYVCSQEYYEELHMAQFPKQPYKIPKKFEIRSSNINNAKSEFEKHANRIQQIAKMENASVIYKIKVDISKPSKKFFKKLLKKDKTKKYNVPLKKNSMKLSNFESFLRKMADQNNHNLQKFDYYVSSSTESQKIATTRQAMLKFKPVVSQLNNYAKIIKPVRNRLITLTA